MDWYNISENHRSRAMRAELDLDASCSDLYSGEFRVKGPVRARWASGGKVPRDFVCTTHMLLLASDRVRNAVLSTELRGIEFVEVALTDRTKAVHTYWLVVPKGKCGKLSFPLKVERYLDEFWMATGIVPDMEGYDHSDFAVPDRTLALLCSERAVRVLRSLDVTNLEIVPSTEAQMVFPKREIDVARRLIRLAD